MKKFMYIIYLIFGKTVGKAWIFAALPFRAYANNYVFNYVLQNNMPLKRLYERGPKWRGNVAALCAGEISNDGWVLEDIHGLSSQPQKLRGFIKWRKVNKLQFYLIVFFIWSWLDADSNQDTTDTGYIKTLITGERKSWHRIFNPWLRKIDFDAVVYGNSFDLGDIRARHPFFNWVATFVWNERNTAMNFQYLFWEY